MSGTTLHAYFGRFFDGFTTGTTAAMGAAVGSTGNASGKTGFIGLTAPFIFNSAQVLPLRWRRIVFLHLKMLDHLETLCLIRLVHP